MSHPKILLYYAFAPVSDPEAVRLWQRELCESLGLRGRIIISKHGINGTVGGEIDACKQYLKRTREYGPFSGLDVKWSEGTGFDELAPAMLKGVDRSAPWQAISDFPKLSVKVRDELVAFGIPAETVVDETGVVGGGTHLSPEKVNELVAERGDDVVFFDGRNAWEAEIGRFKGAVRARREDDARLHCADRVGCVRRHQGQADRDVLHGRDPLRDPLGRDGRPRLRGGLPNRRRHRPLRRGASATTASGRARSPCSTAARRWTSRPVPR